ncbi:AraC-like DNA-binding protein [Brevundimonas vesicularis]|uniref:AraC-like DNA-binding protein n=1 Tax=Brevundimonas vesicularis TaxID=41276 RepID=A0A7W9FRH0_BREVE|nr:AraC family transcriptional regulator [Brevundimonas vesicularis]MBB5770252.1 AraC-like DNA-binding protein [Brevundimonas vesicularis]
MSNMSADVRPLVAFEPARVVEAQRLIERVKRCLSTDRKSAEAGLSQLTDLFRSEYCVAPSAERGLSHWQRRRVDQYIEDNLERSIECRFLADLAGLSHSYFAAAFRISFGESPRAHLIRRRLLRARAMMLETRQSLAEIAIGVGFADQAHLTRHFRRLFGDTPAAWRRASELGRPPERYAPWPTTSDVPSVSAA